jgi:hypothetical protein
VACHDFLACLFSDDKTSKTLGFVLRSVIRPLTSNARRGIPQFNGALITAETLGLAGYLPGTICSARSRQLEWVSKYGTVGGAEHVKIIAIEAHYTMYSIYAMPATNALI